MRWIPLIAVVLSACSTAPKQQDPTTSATYRKDVQELAQLAHQADDAFKAGKSDDAAALIEKAQPVMKRVLEVPRPTLDAALAASDIDDLYGRMLFSNHHYGWAQMMFQKNLSRWKHWDPPNEETARRLKQAESEIAECTKKMEQ